MDKKLQTYESAGITVTFAPSICTHSGNCVRGLPGVFNATGKPWIQPGAATPDAVAAQVERCPSGALKYVRA